MPVPLNSPVLVDLTGIEPATSWMPSRRPPIGTSGPYLVVLGRVELPSIGYQPIALPLSYRTVVATRRGFEPRMAGFGVLPAPESASRVAARPGFEPGHRK